jgi:hypothetical protein
MYAGRKLTPEEEKFVVENKGLFYELYEIFCEQAIQRGKEIDRRDTILICGSFFAALGFFMLILLYFFIL